MGSKFPPFWRIVLGSVGLSCALGLAIDLVTAHVAVEYFSVHHPKVLSTNDPLPLALYWGVAASWWFGLIAGLILGLVNLRQAHPLQSPRILAMIAKACMAIWIFMMSVLVGVYLLTSLAPLNQRGPHFESDRRLVAVAMAHATEYVVGALATIILGLRIRYLSQKTAVGNK